MLEVLFWAVMAVMAICGAVTYIGGYIDPPINEHKQKVEAYRKQNHVIAKRVGREMGKTVGRRLGG